MVHAELDCADGGAESPIKVQRRSSYPFTLTSSSAALSAAGCVAEQINRHSVIHLFPEPSDCNEGQRAQRATGGAAMSLKTTGLSLNCTLFTPPFKKKNPGST